MPFWMFETFDSLVLKLEKITSIKTDACSRGECSLYLELFEYFFLHVNAAYDYLLIKIPSLCKTSCELFKFWC